MWGLVGQVTHLISSTTLFPHNIASLLLFFKRTVVECVTNSLLSLILWNSSLYLISSSSKSVRVSLILTHPGCPLSIYPAIHFPIFTHPIPVFSPIIIPIHLFYLINNIIVILCWLVANLVLLIKKKENPP